VLRCADDLDQLRVARKRLNDKYPLSASMLFSLLRGRHTRMCGFRLTNIQHSKNGFVLDNFTTSVFIVELLKF